MAMRKGKKSNADATVVKETAVEEPVAEIVVEEPVAEVEVEPESIPDLDPVVEVVVEVSAEDAAKSTVTTEVGHNECPYCGCVDVLKPAGIIQSEELHEYRCDMCGKIHGYNVVLQEIAWMNS